MKCPYNNTVKDDRGQHHPCQGISGLIIDGGLTTCGQCQTDADRIEEANEAAHGQ